MNADQRFFAALRSACRRKPVVVWKGGRTEAGARAIFSHTAALASEARTWDAAMRQAGALSVDSIEEMVDVVKGLLYMPAAIGPASGGRPGIGKRVGLIAMTGGQSVVIADAFAQAGLEVPLLSAASYEKLSSFFNIIGGSYRNPLDAGGTLAMGFRVDNLQRMLDILDEDPNIDAIAIETGVAYLARRGALHSSLLNSLLDVLSGHMERSRKPFLLILQAGRVRGAPGIRPHGLMHLQGLNGPPAARRAPIGTLPSDSRIDAGQRVERLDRAVGAEGKRRPRLKE